MKTPRDTFLGTLAFRHDIWDTLFTLSIINLRINFVTSFLDIKLMETFFQNKMMPNSVLSLVFSNLLLWDATIISKYLSCWLILQYYLEFINCLLMFIFSPFVSDFLSIFVGKITLKIVYIIVSFLLSHNKSNNLQSFVINVVFWAL